MSEILSELNVPYTLPTNPNLKATHQHEANGRKLARVSSGVSTGGGRRRANGKVGTFPDEIHPRRMGHFTGEKNVVVAVYCSTE